MPKKGGRYTPEQIISNLCEVEVHTNTAEGMWTGLRNFLRLFHSYYKRYLCGYVAVHECSTNRKRISPAFISGLVKVHSFNSRAKLLLEQEVDNYFFRFIPIIRT